MPPSPDTARCPRVSRPRSCPHQRWRHERGVRPRSRALKERPIGKRSLAVTLYLRAPASPRDRRVTTVGARHHSRASTCATRRARRARPSTRPRVPHELRHVRAHPHLGARRPRRSRESGRAGCRRTEVVPPTSPGSLGQASLNLNPSWRKSTRLTNGAPAARTPLRRPAASRNASAAPERRASTACRAGTSPAPRAPRA